MCDQCTGSTPDGSGADAARKGLSRRALLAMGTSAAAGVVLGLWNCQNPPSATQGGRGAATSRAGSGAASSSSASAGVPVTSRAATTAASGTESKPATTVSATTSTQAASASQAGTQTTQANATTTRATPDLGSEVFPDARGKAIAKASEAPVIIVPRTDWTVARPDFGHIEAMNGINRITVHHTAGEIQTDAWRPTANELEGIREFHAGTRPTDRNWADIAYHFAIDRAGRVWQARPLAYQGAHAKGHNQHNLGIVLLGNFAVQSPSAAQLTSLTLFVGFVRKLYAVPLANVFTHGELVDTECPGTLLQEFMDRGRKAWGDADGIAWDKVTTHPASDPASTTAAGQ